MMQMSALDELLPLVKCAELLAQKYDVVVTNPPYMAVSNAGAKVNDYVKKNFPDSKADMFAVFIERCGQMAKKDRYQAMITQHAWMFLSSFENLRTKLLAVDIVNMAHLGARAFEEIGGEVVQTTSFVVRKSHIADYKGEYCRLIEPTSQQGKEDMFLSGKNQYAANQADYKLIPGTPIAYWVSHAFISNFSNSKPIGETRKGMVTADNPRFIRSWNEVDFAKIGFNHTSRENALNSRRKWFPYVKGGEFRRWYGNLDWVVNWENDGFELLNMKNEGYKVGSTNQNLSFIFKPAVYWTKISSVFSARIVETGFLYDDASPFISIKSSTDRLLCLGFFNSPVCQSYLDLMNPTMNFSPGTIANLPYIKAGEMEDPIKNTVAKCVELSSDDWDSYETSWDFKRNPLI